MKLHKLWFVAIAINLQLPLCPVCLKVKFTYRISMTRLGTGLSVIVLVHLLVKDVVL